MPKKEKNPKNLRALIYRLRPTKPQVQFLESNFKAIRFFRNRIIDEMNPILLTNLAIDDCEWSILSLTEKKEKKNGKSVKKQIPVTDGLMLQVAEKLIQSFDYWANALVKKQDFVKGLIDIIEDKSTHKNLNSIVRKFVKSHKENDKVQFDNRKYFIKKYRTDLIAKGEFEEIAMTPERTFSIAAVHANKAIDKYYENRYNGNIAKWKNNYKKVCATNGKTYKKEVYDRKGMPKKKRPEGRQSIGKDRIRVDFEKGVIYWSKGIAIRFDIDFKKDKCQVYGGVFSKKKGETYDNIKTCNIIKSPSGKYWVSIKFDLGTNESDLPKLKAPVKETSIGIDVGAINYATISKPIQGNTNNNDLDEFRVIEDDYTIYANPRHLKKSIERILFYQRELSRRKKKTKEIEYTDGKTGELVTKMIWSNNREKTRIKLAKAHERVVNQRKVFLDKLTTEIVSNPNIQTIIIEDLNIKGMTTKNKAKRNDQGTGFIQNNKRQKAGLNRSILDAAWGTFFSMLEYKCKSYGKRLIRVDRFFPSSKNCKDCGERNPEVKNLGIRIWECPKCSCINERDKTAAKNLEKEGLSMYNKGKVA